MMISFELTLYQIMEGEDSFSHRRVISCTMKQLVDVVKELFRSYGAGSENTRLDIQYQISTILYKRSIHGDRVYEMDRFPNV